MKDFLGLQEKSGSAGTLAFPPQHERFYKRGTGEGACEINVEVAGR